MISCLQPWFEMQIEYNGTAGCCCYYKHDRDRVRFDRPTSIKDYWNSMTLQAIRRDLSSDSLTGTGCEGCQALRYGSLTDFTAIDNGINKTQRDNWLKALENYNQGTTLINSLPVRYYFNFGLQCNLKCIMCCQQNARVAENRNLPEAFLLSLKEYLLPANEIMVIGGEPLLIPTALRFIEAFANDKDYSGHKLSIVTNGTLLDRHMKLLEKMKRVTIWVSLDSTGNCYEDIRQGAEWQKTEKNVLRFRDTGAANKADWNIKIGCVVMKRSLERLPEFVDWCISNDLPVHFVPIHPQGFTRQEEIFHNPGLLREIEGWEDKFDAAIEKLTSKGWIETGVRPLRLMKRELKSRLLVLEGEELFNKGRVKIAHDKFKEALKNDSLSADALNNLGVTSWRLGQQGEAVSHFREALSMEPFNRNAVLNCGRLLCEMGQHDEAMRLYIFFLKTNISDEDISRAIAAIYCPDISTDESGRLTCPAPDIRVEEDKLNITLSGHIRVLGIPLSEADMNIGMIGVVSKINRLLSEGRARLAGKVLDLEMRSLRNYNEIRFRMTGLESVDTGMSQ